jgi:hypothetical protein
MKNLITKEEKDKIDLICKEYNIENYTINSDGSIDVNGDAIIKMGLLVTLPLKFRHVSGRFVCTYNKLTTLVGSPISVGGDFNCGDNKLLTLDGAPNTVGGDFSCYGNNLTSLKGAPGIVNGAFIFWDNDDLSTLEGAPHIIGNGIFGSNKNLISTYCGDTDIELSGVCLLGESLPQLLTDNIDHMPTIVKYQRHFYIWNDDLSLNIENFQLLLDEIKDGLL